MSDNIAVNTDSGAGRVRSDLDQVQKIVQCMGAPNEDKWPGGLVN